MKIRFNDATELQIQSVNLVEETLQIKTISTTFQKLREKFSDRLACKKLEVIEREQVIAVYENYTELYRMEDYGSGIIGAVLCKEKETPEVKNELMNAAVIVAKANAQGLSDQDARKVKVLYDEWEELVKKGFTAEKAEFKFIHLGVLYKTVNANHKFLENWVPGQGTESVFTCIDEIHAGTKEDPIPALENMEYEKGKIYIEKGNLYLMNRPGMTEGEKIILQFLPSVLAGAFFEEVM